jgi:hypothetical protein
MKPLELRDIHLPDGALWWPLAPGWWLLLVLLLGLVLLLLLAPRIVRRLRQKSLRRLCLLELGVIRQNLVSGQSQNSVIADTAALLRRTVISYRGRNGYAGATGADWLLQLQDLAQGQSFSPAQLELLARHRYQREFECDLESLLQACERWICALPRSEPHVSD